MKPKNMPAAQLASNNTKNLTLTLTTTSGAASDGVKKRGHRKTPQQWQFGTA